MNAKMVWVAALLAMVAGVAAAAEKVVLTTAVNSPEFMPYLEVKGAIAHRETVSLTATENAEIKTMLELGERVRRGQVVAVLEDLELDLLIQKMKSRLTELAMSAAYLEKKHRAANALHNEQYEGGLALEKSLTDIDVIRSQSAAVEAELAILVRKRAKLTVVSPVDGVVVSRLHKPGEFVEAFTPVIEIEDHASTQIRFRVSADSARSLQVGDEVGYRYRGARFAGRVAGLFAIEQGYSFIHEVRLDTGGTDLAAGALVTVELPLNIEEDFQIIPDDALVINQEGFSVVTVNEESKARVVPVELLGRFKSYVLIAKALNLRDPLVVRGNEALTDNERVKVIGQLEYAIF